MPIQSPVDTKKAAGIALHIQDHAKAPTGWFSFLDKGFVKDQLKGLSPQEIGAVFDYVNQGVDGVTLKTLEDKYDGVSDLASRPDVKQAMQDHQQTSMVVSDVDKTLLAPSQQVYAGMKSLLDVLGENGGNTHVISLRVKPLEPFSDVALKGGGVAVNSTHAGSFGNFGDAAHAHFDDVLKLFDPGAKGSLDANKEHEFAEAGHGKFLASQEFDARNPGRSKDYLGDTNEGDKYFFLEKLEEDDANKAAGKPSVLGLCMLHIVDDSPIPQALTDEAQKPDARVLLYKDAGDLAAQLANRGRISDAQKSGVVDQFQKDKANGLP